MSVKDTAMVARRIALAKDLSAGIDASAAEITVGFADYLSPALEEGETLFDTRQQLGVLSRRVTRHREALESLDGGVLLKNHDTDMVREKTNKLSDAVTSKLRSVRHTCRGGFGPDSLKRIGLTGRFPTAAPSVYRQGRIVQTGLRNPDLEFEGVFDVPGEDPVVSPVVLADRLEPELSELGRFVDSRYSELRKDTDARDLRRKAVQEFDDGMLSIVLMVKGIFRAAGRADLADRFHSRYRRIVRRAASQGESPEPPADTAPEEPVDTTSDESDSTTA